jgi:hypothetical protein
VACQPRLTRHCHRSYHARETTTAQSLQECIICEAGTLYSLLMLKKEMSQASLRSLLGHCESIFGVRPITLLHWLFHYSGSGLEVCKGEVALRQPTSSKSCFSFLTSRIGPKSCLLCPKDGEYMCCHVWKAIASARRRPRVPHGGLEIFGNIEASTIHQKYTAPTLCNGEKLN